MLGSRLFACAAPDDLVHRNLPRYDVAWDTLGHDSADSMPLGNGDIALNVWTEANGDILLYVSKSDAWTEDGNLVKVARVRISLSPNPFVSGTAFQQILKLEDSEIQISSGSSATVRIRVEANHPVVRIESETTPATTMKVALEQWRSNWVTDDPKTKNTSPDFLLPKNGDPLCGSIAMQGNVSPHHCEP